MSSQQLPSFLPKRQNRTIFSVPQMSRRHIFYVPFDKIFCLYAKKYKVNCSCFDMFTSQWFRKGKALFERNKCDDPFRCFRVCEFVKFSLFFISFHQVNFRRRWTLHFHYNHYQFVIDIYSLNKAVHTTGKKSRNNTILFTKNTIRIIQQIQYRSTKNLAAVFLIF